MVTEYVDLSAAISGALVLIYGPATQKTDVTVWVNAGLYIADSATATYGYPIAAGVGAVQIPVSDNSPFTVRLQIGESLYGSTGGNTSLVGVIATKA